MTMRTTLAMLAVAALTLAACSEPTTSASPLAPTAPSAIVNGTYTPSAYPSVGGLLLDWNNNGIDGDDLYCTGSLISPTVFLTAAHCVVGEASTAQWYVSFAPDLFAKGAKFIEAERFAYDPQYGHDQANLHDLAVIILPAGATKGLTPYGLPKRGELDALSAKGALSDAIFVNVG
jgi:secreted trypsin-like serine protease